MKVVKVIRTIFDIIIVLFAVICISLFTFVKIAWMEILVVQSGSMEPTINVDDIVIIQPVDIKNVKADDIITYEDKGTLVTHRVVEVDNTDSGIQLKMKGDNNNIEDKTRVTKDNIVGIYVNRIDKAADLYYFIKSPYGIIAIIGVPLLIYMILSLIIYIKTPDKKEDTEVNVEVKNEDSTDIR